MVPIVGLWRYDRMIIAFMSFPAVENDRAKITFAW
jgi:hypothetical protein